MGVMIGHWEMIEFCVSLAGHDSGCPLGPMPCLSTDSWPDKDAIINVGFILWSGT